MKRGDIVLVAIAGDYGKPRPAVIIQSDGLTTNSSLLVCLVTSHQFDASLYRLPIAPDPGNGLRRQSDIMVDKIAAVPRKKCHTRIGRLNSDQMAQFNELLTFVVGLAG